MSYLLREATLTLNEKKSEWQAKGLDKKIVAFQRNEVVQLLTPRCHFILSVTIPLQDKITQLMMVLHRYAQ